MRDLLRALRRTRGIAAAPCRLYCALLVTIAVASLFSDSGRGQESGEKLRIATWGGAYAQSQEAAYFGPFTQQTGIAVETETYDGSTAAIKGAIEAGASPLDVVDVSRAALETLCRDGLLEPISPSIIAAAPDGPPPSEDYFAPGLSPCGVASMAWSATVAYDRQALKTPPARIADLLDTKRFPGSRALPKSARYTLEFLLLADGVAPGDIYRELSTPEGVDRAFAALDKIKGRVLWWDKAQDPIAWLVRKKATMAVGYSGRLFRAVVGARQLNILWDGQIYDVDHWAIPKSAKNKDAAQRFIAFASAPDRMAAQAALIAYGPMRRSAVNLVGKHPAIGVDMKRYLPTAPENFANVLLFEAGWWTEHGAPLEERFAAWLAQSVADSAETGSVPEKPQPPAAQPAKQQPKRSPPRR